MTPPRLLASSIESVVVFRSGAVVTRSVRLEGPNWPDEVALDGLPLALDDESVRVSLVPRTPGSTVPRPGDVRVSLVLPPAGENLVPPSQHELLAASDTVLHLETRLRRIEQELALFDSIYLHLASPTNDRPPRPAPTVAWRGVLEWIQRAKLARLEEKSRLTDEQARALEHQARLYRKLQEVRAASDSKQDSIAKRVLVRLRDAGDFVEADLRLEYQVPGARWVPTYVFRMGRDGHSASLGVRALVVQRTGESWQRIRLSVSTANLLQSSEFPELKSLRIGRRQPTPPKRGWRPPPTGADALFEGLDRALSTMPPPPPLAPPDTKPLPPPPPPPPMLGGAPRDMRTMAAPANKPASPKAAKESAKRKGGAQPEGAPKTAAPLQQPSSIPAPSMPAMMDRPMPSPAPRMRAEEQAAAPPAGATYLQAKMLPQSEMSMDFYAADDDEIALDKDEDTGKFAAFGGGGADLNVDGLLAPLRPEAGILRYTDLVMAGWQDQHPRGKLRPITLSDRLEGLESSVIPLVAQRLSEAYNTAVHTLYVPFPSETSEVASSSGTYDYRYDAEGLVDVPADGKIHNVPLFLRQAPVETTLILVPREGDQTFRVASMKNPLQAPLLAGPAEIYLEDEFLVTSLIRTVPAGGQLKVGLGLEPGIKVARNAHFEEETHGVFGSGISLHHRVSIEVVSRLAVSAKLEVRERVPIKEDQDKDVEIVVPEANPPWEDFDQADTSRIKGGKRWVFVLKPGETKKLEFAYTVKIAGKSELTGGNRRE